MTMGITGIFASALDLAKIGGVYGFLLAALDFGIAFVIAFVAGSILIQP